VDAQNLPESPFYAHFSGNLDTTMFLTLDLFENQGKLTGYYFYYFKLPGQENMFHYGKTIHLTGSILGTSIKLHEFDSKESKFSGVLKDKMITGKWKRREYEDPIPFNLLEDYSNGSIALNCFTMANKQKLIHEIINGENLPSAKINILLLYPKEKIPAVLKDSIDYMITRFMADEEQRIKSPELLMANITFDFFASYVAATKGISDISRTSVFNWEKKISMDVKYNNNHIVSLGFEKYGYTGGDHGISIKKFAVIDIRSSRALKLRDFLKPGYEAVLNKILDNKLRKLNGVLPDANLSKAGFLVNEIELTENFYINNDGLGFYYNVYHLASYSSGTTELLINFYEIKDILREDHPFSWVKPTPKNK